ncbi:MAG: hypothetical protein HYZ69_03700 [Candidatus Colwellbacteria bacterium]|nr:hypothetical protein [Candidatus Colwellbacteria bacterium]
MRGFKNFPLSAVLLSFVFCFPAVSSFGNTDRIEKNVCQSAAESLLELFDIEERAFQAATECLPMSANPDCAPGELKELVSRSETLKKKVIEIAHACLEN